MRRLFFAFNGFFTSTHREIERELARIEHWLFLTRLGKAGLDPLINRDYKDRVIRTSSVVLGLSVMAMALEVVLAAVRSTPAASSSS